MDSYLASALPLPPAARESRYGMMTLARHRAYGMKRTHEEAYVAAFDEFADALFRHARLRLSDRDRARDLVQDTFVKAWDYLAGGGEIRSWKSFLFRVLNNLIVDEYRKSRTVSLDELMEEESFTIAPALATGGLTETEDAFDAALALERVRAAVADLPEGYRTVVTLRYIDGFTPKEIAEMLETSENVISVRLHRAVARLKEWLTR